EALLQRAIEADPDRLQAYALLGQLYVRQKRLDEAKARFDDVLKRNPKSVGASTMMGMLLEQQGKPAEAEKEYKRTLTIDPRAATWLAARVSMRRSSSPRLPSSRCLTNPKSTTRSVGFTCARTCPGPASAISRPA